MFWAFAKGMADTTLASMQEQQRSEDEQQKFLMRLQMQEKIQMDAEERRKKWEKVAEGYDPKSGNFYTVRADGTRTEAPAPQGFKDEYQEKKNLEKMAREAEAADKLADNKRADRAIDIQGGYLAQSRENAKYERERNKTLDMATLAKAGLGYGAGGGVFPMGTPPKAGSTLTENAAASQAQRAYDTILREGDDNMKAAAAAVMASPGTYAEKLTALNQLRGKQFAQSGPGGVVPVGTVEDGYEYLGGDPSQPSSWKKVN